MANLLRAVVLCLLILAVWLLPQEAIPPLAAELPAALPAQARDWRFGVVESYEDPSAASNLGVAWTRVRFHWSYVQSGGPGTWTPRVTEAQINGELAAGRTVVGILIGIPDWARDSNRLPAGLWLPHDDPHNTWANYVRQAVSRYNGRINHWVIWNEPDIADPGAPGHTWDGAIEDFFQLQRVAYLVAKETNPNTTIHLAAFTYFWDPGYFNRFLEVVMADPAAADHNHYFDVATAHLYFQPNSIFNIIQSFYGAMGNHGIWKPVWLVETNAPPIDDPTWPVSNWTLSVTQDEQAAFIPQAMASALAAGAQRIAIYKMKDTEGDRAANPEPFGLLRADGSRRPAYTTYQVAIGYMGGMTGVRRERWNEVGQIWLDQGEKSTTVLFSRLPAPQVAEVTATAETAVLADMWGTRRTITAQNGVFRVELPGALCTQPIGDYCMIGGTTFYLVQAKDGGAPPEAPGIPGGPPTQPTEEGTAVASLPDPTPTLTVTTTLTPTVTATATATATPTATATNTPTIAPTATATDSPTPGADSTLYAITPSPAAVTSPATADAPTGRASYWLLGLALLLGLGIVIYANRARPG
jgi:hypothetical protein